jgi:hypothetical protein
MVDGGGLLFITFTAPHDIGDDLRALFETVATAWRTVIGCRAVREFRSDNPFEFVRAAEVTHGANGFHPHLHVILATQEPLDRATVTALRPELFDPWASAIVNAGYRMPSDEFGMKLVRADASVSDYATKVEGLAVELTSQGTKTRGKTDPMFAVLRRAAAGDVRAQAIWTEYELGTKGRRSLTFSRQMRALLAMGGERSESELYELGEGKGDLLFEFRGYMAELLVRCPGGLRIVLDGIGDGSPESIDFVLSALRATAPRTVKRELELMFYGRELPAELPALVVLGPDSEQMVLGDLVEVGF